MSCLCIHSTRLNPTVSQESPTQSQCGNREQETDAYPLFFDLLVCGRPDDLISLLDIIAMKAAIVVKFTVHMQYM